MMFSVNASLSALMAYGKRMGVHANNIANMYSRDFSKSRVLMQEGPDQTVRAEIEVVETQVPPGKEAADNRHPEEVPDTENSLLPDALAGEVDGNVDLAEEIVGTMISQNGYNANLKMVKAQDEMIGALLDISS